MKVFLVGLSLGLVVFGAPECVEVRNDVVVGGTSSLQDDTEEFEAEDVETGNMGQIHELLSSTNRSCLNIFSSSFNGSSSSAPPILLIDLSKMTGGVTIFNCTFVDGFQIRLKQSTTLQLLRINISSSYFCDSPIVFDDVSLTGQSQISVTDSTFNLTQLYFPRPPGAVVGSALPSSVSSMMIANDDEEWRKQAWSIAIVFGSVRLSAESNISFVGNTFISYPSGEASHSLGDGFYDEFSYNSDGLSQVFFTFFAGYLLSLTPPTPLDDELSPDAGGRVSLIASSFLIFADGGEWASHSAVFHFPPTLSTNPEAFNVQQFEIVDCHYSVLVVETPSPDSLTDGLTAQSFPIPDWMRGTQLINGGGTGSLGDADPIMGVEVIVESEKPTETLSALSSPGYGRFFFHFGAPPSVAFALNFEETLTSSVGSQMILASNSKLLIRNNTFFVGSPERIDPERLASLFFTRSYLFHFMWSSLSLSEGATLDFIANRVQMKSFQHAFVFYFTGKPPRLLGAFTGPRSTPMTPKDEPFLSLTSDSSLCILENDIVLHSYATNWLVYGAVSIFATDLPGWKEVYSKTVLLIEGNSRFSITNNSLNTTSSGVDFGQPSTGTVFAIGNGTSSITTGGQLRSRNAMVFARCPHSIKDGMYVQSTERMNLVRCAAYTSATQWNLDHSGLLEMSDEVIDIQNCWSAYVWMAVPNYPGWDTSTALSTYLLQLSNGAAVRVNPKKVTLMAFSAAFGVDFKYAQIQNGNIFQNGGLIEIGNGPSNWTVGLTATVAYATAVSFSGLMSSYNAWVRSYKGIWNLFCNRTMVKMTGLGSIAILWERQELTDVTKSDPYLFTLFSQINIFCTFASHLHRIGPDWDERAVIELTRTEEEITALIEFKNQLFLYLGSNMTLLVGTNITINTLVAGPVFWMWDRIRLYDEASFLIGDCKVNQTVPISGGAAVASALYLQRGEMLLQTGASFNLIGVESHGFPLFMNYLTDDTNDNMYINSHARVTVANCVYIPRSAAGYQPAAALILQVSLYLEFRGQLQLWGNSIATDLLSASTETVTTHLNVILQSSILIAENVIAGSAFKNSGRWRMDDSSAFTLSGNLFTLSTPPLVSQSISNRDSTLDFGSSNLVARCNRRLLPEEAVLKGFVTSDSSPPTTLVDNTDRFPYLGGGQWDEWGRHHRLNIQSCGQVCGQNALHTSPDGFQPYCSPIATAPIAGVAGQPAPQLNRTYVKVIPESKPGNLPGFPSLSVSSPMCTCSCTGAYQNLTLDEKYVDLPLSAPFCTTALPLRLSNMSTTFPDFVPGAILAPKTSTPLPVYVIVIIAILGALLTVGTSSAAVVFRRKQHQLLLLAEASQKLIDDANAVPSPDNPTDWKTKPTAVTFRKGKQIGSGGFGRVFVGLDDASGRLLAAKEISLNDDPNKEKTLKLLGREIGVMRKLSHRNVVQYLGADRSPSGDFYIFMEYLPGGSLRGLINSYGYLNPRVAAAFTKQALEGLVYLHEMQVIHRDIKACNMLMDRDGVLKLADLGCAQNFNSIQSMRGTPLWMAPECVRQDDEGAGTGPASDIWSLGCTVMEMLTGKLPFEWYGNAFAVMRAVSEGGKKLEKAFEMAPDSLKKSEHGLAFVKACCSFEPEDRPTAKQLLQHEFLTKEWLDIELGLEERSQERQGSNDSKMASMQNTTSLGMSAPYESIAGSSHVATDSVGSTGLKTGLGLPATTLRRTASNEIPSSRSMNTIDGETCTSRGLSIGGGSVSICPTAGGELSLGTPGDMASLLQSIRQEILKDGERPKEVGLTGFEEDDDLSREPLVNPTDVGLSINS